MKTQRPTVNYRGIIKNARNPFDAIGQLKEQGGLDTGRARIQLLRHDPAGFNVYMRHLQRTDGGRLQHL